MLGAPRFLVSLASFAVGVAISNPRNPVASDLPFLTDELLDEVLADPNNDDPRRVYADWLAERGDPRGEFIAVQCELARNFDFQLAVREQQLRREHGARWSAEIGVAARHVTFRRGFAERLELGVGDLAAIDVARVPLRSLVVTGVCDANVRRLVTLPAIPTLVTFGLRGANLNAKAQRRLARRSGCSRPHRCSRFMVAG